MTRNMTFHYRKTNIAHSFYSKTVSGEHCYTLILKINFKGKWEASISDFKQNKCSNIQTLVKLRFMFSMNS